MFLLKIILLFIHIITKTHFVKLYFRLVGKLFVLTMEQFFDMLILHVNIFFGGGGLWMSARRDFLIREESTRIKNALGDCQNMDSTPPVN
jgi:hypothetical protein